MVYEVSLPLADPRMTTYLTAPVTAFHERFICVVETTVAAEITRAWCAEHGVVHLSKPYLTALHGASSFMRNAWANYSAADPVAVRGTSLVERWVDVVVGGGADVTA